MFTQAWGVGQGQVTGIPPTENALSYALIKSPTSRKKAADGHSP